MRHARLVSGTCYRSGCFFKSYAYFTRVSKRPANFSGLIWRGTLKYISFKKYYMLA